MQLSFLDALPSQITNDLGSTVSEGAMQIAGHPLVLVGGIVLIIVTVLVILFLKRVILNSILGVIGWAIVVYVLKIELPFVASLVISIVFGLAGVGTLLVLKFFGLV